MQTGIEPEFILFFDCPEEEMEKRILSRNQVKNLVGCLVMCLKSATCMGIFPGDLSRDIKRVYFLSPAKDVYFLDVSHKLLSTEH
jgi:hypothetical protein